MTMDASLIEQWAREAGFEDVECGTLAGWDQLHRLCAIVAAHEREACAKVCEAEEFELSHGREDGAYNLALSHAAAAIRVRQAESTQQVPSITTESVDAMRLAAEDEWHKLEPNGRSMPPHYYEWFARGWLAAIKARK